MALTRALYEWLKPYLCVPRLLSLGHPDMLFAGSSRLGVVQETEVRQRHGYRDHPELGLVNPRIMFQDMGTELTVLDRDARADIRLNLNDQYEYARHRYSAFSAVLDNGTTEHVFNIGEAWQTMYQACNWNGYLIHINPFDKPNHGYWCPQPRVYTELYKRETILHHWMMRGGTFTDLTPEQRSSRFKPGTFPGAVHVVVVQKTGGTWWPPVQEDS